MRLIACSFRKEALGSQITFCPFFLTLLFHAPSYSVETKDGLRRFRDMLAKTPLPTSYADLCSGLTRSGVTNLAEFEHGVTSFGARIASSEELQHHLRPPARARAAPVAMTTLEAVAIHLLTLDNWDNPANSVNRVINMAVSVLKTK